MIEHIGVFFISVVLLIFWGVGTTALGYYSFNPFDRIRTNNLAFFIAGVFQQIVLCIILSIIYILGWAILKGISIIL